MRNGRYVRSLVFIPFRRIACAVDIGGHHIVLCFHAIIYLLFSGIYVACRVCWGEGFCRVVSRDRRGILHRLKACLFVRFDGVCRSELFLVAAGPDTLASRG